MNRFVSLIFLVSLFSSAPASWAIPVRHEPRLSVMAQLILESDEAAAREQIVSTFRNHGKTVQLRSFGIGKSEVERLVFSLSDRELYALQKVFELSATRKGDGDLLTTRF